MAATSAGDSVATTLSKSASIDGPIERSQYEQDDELIATSSVAFSSAGVSTSTYNLPEIDEKLNAKNSPSSDPGVGASEVNSTFAQRPADDSSEIPVSGNRANSSFANEASDSINAMTDNFSRMKSPYFNNASLLSADSDSEFDSALLAGMRDARERVALLRLEISLLDFMKSDWGWLEVGGAYNSVVLTPSSIKARQDIPGTANSAEFLSAGNVLSEPAPGQRQTSFQKCILHRLADRFGIVREPGSLLIGSLRLIKLSTSKIPVKLLQDLEPADYMNNSNVYDSRQQYDSVPYYKANGSEQQQFNTLTKSFGNASLVEPRDGVATAANSLVLKPGKMKIMKRSDKHEASPRDNLGSNNQKNYMRRNSSELSDKERAYAEARARIFNEESSAGVDTDKNVAAFVNNTATTRSNNDNIIFPSESSTNVNTNDTYDSSKIEGSESFTGQSDRKPNSASLYQQESFGGLLQPPIPQVENTLQSSGHESSGNLAQLESKAVYRNRAEEAADPDFRRHRSNAAIVPTATVFGMSSSIVAAAPLLAPSTAPTYPGASAWVTAPRVSYPLIQHQPLPQSVPYFALPHHQHPGQLPLHPQQQHYAYQHQPLHLNSYDHVGTLPLAPHPTGSVNGGNLGYQNNGIKDYSNRFNSGFKPGGAVTKPRPVTLTAAAPAFYPSASTTVTTPSRMASLMTNEGGTLDNNAVPPKQS